MGGCSLTAEVDTRLEELTSWAESVLSDHDLSIEPASADASFRRYFRVQHHDESQIIMDAPPDKEDSEPFVRIAGYLQEMGLSAPRVLQQSESKGFYLLSDLGDQQYLPNLNEYSAAQLYTDAMRALSVMHLQGQKYENALPPYDRSLLQAEMDLFQDWYLGRHLELELSVQQKTVLQDSFEWLILSALEQPRVFVHRDYHSRNLMVLEPTSANPATLNPGILDFQDAVWGPITYDLVSLLRDCYIRWSPTLVESWAKQFYDQMNSTSLLQGVTESQFIRWFDLMGIQRHLKATGIFCRLNYRDNKPGYLNDIPRTMSYILGVATKYPELNPFMDLMDELGLIESVQKANL